MTLPRTPDLDALLDLALAEDIGYGDVTTQATVPPDAWGKARLVARAPGVLAGGELVALVYARVDPRIHVRQRLGDGSAVAAGECVAELEGPARGLLTGERTALNFLQHLSGIATRTARMVELVAGTGARVIDTRKTIPGLRALAKYAVRAGGGTNHRHGLSDGVLIKDNHLIAAGGVGPAVAAARAACHHLLRIEVEVDTLEHLEEALAAGADVVLLDNMSLAQLRVAVARCRGRAVTEASGGVNEATVRDIAETGVDYISVGALTHSVTALDLGLDWGEE